MTVLTEATLSDIGVDGVAIKPSEIDVERATALEVSMVTIDYEGPEHVPGPTVLADLADEFEVRLTVPVRADGFDPLGDDSVRSSIPSCVREVHVAGHPAYLKRSERKRPIAPRLHAAREGESDPWVGTEGIERLALAVGGTQFELLSGTTQRDVQALRAAGYDGGIAVYAPTVLTADEDTVLDAIGDYAARRKHVREALPDELPTDSRLNGEYRPRLLAACHDYSLAGTPDTVAEQVASLHRAGVDHVISYPARDDDTVLSTA